MCGILIFTSVGASNVSFRWCCQCNYLNIQKPLFCLKPVFALFCFSVEELPLDIEEARHEMDVLDSTR